MAIAYLGDDFSQEELARVMGSYWYGTPASKILRLDSLGYAVNYEQTTLAQLQAYLDQGLPCIIFLRTGGLPYWAEDVAHAVVVVGLETSVVYLHDPTLDDGPTSVDQRAFLLAWSELDHYCAIISSRSEKS